MPYKTKRHVDTSHAFFIGDLIGYTTGLPITVLLLVLTLPPTWSVAGHWQVSMDSPHGPMKGSLEFKQDGTKVSGTAELGTLGSLALKDGVDGAKIAFEIELAEGQGTLKFDGKIEGDKISGSGTTDRHGFAWEASR